MRVIADAIGFEKADLPRGTGRQGPDLWAKNGGVWGVFEAKGGTAKLARGNRAPKLDGRRQYNQFQWNWIDYYYDLLATQNRRESGDGPQLYADRGGPEPIVAMVVSLDLNRKGDKDHLRIGVQPWTINRALWNNWPSRGQNRF